MATKKNTKKSPQIDPHKKPAIFLSHSHEDAILATLLAGQFDNVFGKNAVVFNATSIPNDIPSGTNFFQVINQRIADMNLILFLLTPNSLKSQWVWFEMGSAWKRYEDKDIWLIPLIIGVTSADLPPHFQTIVHTTLSSPMSLRSFYEQRVKDFGQGDVKNIKEAEWAKELEEALKLPTNFPTSDVVSKEILSQILVDLIGLKALSSTYLSNFADIYTPKEIRQLIAEAMKGKTVK